MESSQRTPLESHDTVDPLTRHLCFAHLLQSELDEERLGRREVVNDDAHVLQGLDRTAHLRANIFVAAATGTLADPHSARVAIRRSAHSTASAIATVRRPSGLTIRFPLPSSR
jgi:hypothetical protein